MLSERQQADYLKSYLRRKYAADLTGLKALADTVFAEASEEVTLTSIGFEGGSGSGTVKFNKMTMLGAVEELIAELDPAYVAPITGGRVILPDYSFSTPV